MKRALLLVLFALLLLTPVLAVDRVIVNSREWQDVYSGMLYASLEGVPSNFLVSEKHGAILLYSVPTSEQELFVVSSRQQPYVYNYEPFLQARGYADASELLTRNANLDLARELDTTEFIVLDPAYGYNAISAAPYAVRSGKYVLFADARTIDDVVDFLNDRGPTSLILFGQVDREVKDALAPFSPEVVNEGDRFRNNLEMVDRYLALNPDRQVILTNGEFLEAGLMNGEDPVVFIGKSNVPESVQEYIRSSDIEVGILIGNELIGSATFVRRQLGISVFVKFAQGARVPSGPIAQVEDLDRFPMPSYDLLLEITNVVYNRATRSLEVTYRNPTGLALYFRSTITINGMDIPVITGDQGPVFLDKEEYKTVVYTVDTDDNPLLLEGEDLTAQFFTIFGEGERSLENALQATYDIGFIDVLDDAEIEITGLYYDKAADRFYVTVQNVGDVDAYAQVELVDLLVNGEALTVAGDEVPFVRKGKSAKVPVSVELAEEDFEENPQVLVRAYYGEREVALIKVTEKSFVLEFGGGLVRYVTYAAVVLVVLLLLFFLGTKKTCPHCKHKNPRGRKTCENCHKHLR